MHKSGKDQRKPLLLSWSNQHISHLKGLFLTNMPFPKGQLGDNSPCHSEELSGRCEQYAAFNTSASELHVPPATYNPAAPKFFVHQKKSEYNL